MSHLVIIPDAHGDHFGMVWMRAALAAAEVPPGVVAVRPGLRAGPEMFVHVAPPEQIPEILRVAGDQSALLATSLWQEEVAPLFAP